MSDTAMEIEDIPSPEPADRPAMKDVIAEGVGVEKATTSKSYEISSGYDLPWLAEL